MNIFHGWKPRLIRFLLGSVFSCFDLPWSWPATKAPAALLFFTLFFFLCLLFCLEEDYKRKRRSFSMGLQPWVLKHEETSSDAVPKIRFRFVFQFTKLYKRKSFLLIKSWLRWNTYCLHSVLSAAMWPSTFSVPAPI